jgi:hypothetical protein
VVNFISTSHPGLPALCWERHTQRRRHTNLQSLDINEANLCNTISRLFFFDHRTIFKFISAPIQVTKPLASYPQWSDSGVRLKAINIIVPTALDKNPRSQLFLSSFPKHQKFSSLYITLLFEALLLLNNLHHSLAKAKLSGHQITFSSTSA